jgi:hypothetical protein
MESKEVSNMKKFLVALVLILSASTVYAQAPYCISSGLKTGDAIIYTGPADLCGVEAITDGSNDATCIVYDALSATSTVLFKGKVTSTANFGGVTFPSAVRGTTGLFLDITGTNAACILYYYPR